MSKNIYIALFCFLMMVVLGSCSEFQKVQKSDDLDRKVAAAFSFYEKGDNYKANVLFEEVIPLIKGKAEAEKAEFYFAYTFFKDKQYIMSAYYFKDFFHVYPRSQYAEESRFMAIKSLSLNSPLHKLDQTSTHEGLLAIQLFVNKYPNSTYIPEINKITDEFNSKLEFKAYNNAKLYHKIENYKSAVVALENFRSEFPSSQFNEEISFLILESQYKLAKMSVLKQQKDRYYQAQEYYFDFIDKYPNSKYKKEAESVYQDSTDKINSFNI